MVDEVTMREMDRRFAELEAHLISRIESEAKLQAQRWRDLEATLTARNETLEQRWEGLAKTMEARDAVSSGEFKRLNELRQEVTADRGLLPSRDAFDSLAKEVRLLTNQMVTRPALESIENSTKASIDALSNQVQSQAKDISGIKGWMLGANAVILLVMSGIVIVIQVI